MVIFGLKFAYALIINK